METNYYELYVSIKKLNQALVLENKSLLDKIDLNKELLNRSHEKEVQLLNQLDDLHDQIKCLENSISEHESKVVSVISDFAISTNLLEEANNKITLLETKLSEQNLNNEIEIETLKFELNSYKTKLSALENNVDLFDQHLKSKTAITKHVSILERDSELLFWRLLKRDEDEEYQDISVTKLLDIYFENLLPVVIKNSMLALDIVWLNKTLQGVLFGVDEQGIEVRLNFTDIDLSSKMLLLEVVYQHIKILKSQNQVEDDKENYEDLYKVPGEDE